MTILPQELKTLIDSKADFLLLDVREEWEYEEYHIGGLNIPLNSLPFRLQEIASWKSKMIVIHCKAGTRGRTGTKYLLKHGFLVVKNLEGGVQAFIETFPQAVLN
jgi:rhodanese-related sulfurtransferase